MAAACSQPSGVGRRAHLDPARRPGAPGAGRADRPPVADPAPSPPAAGRTPRPRASTGTARPPSGTRHHRRRAAAGATGAPAPAGNQRCGTALAITSRPSQAGQGGVQSGQRRFQLGQLGPVLLDHLGLGALDELRVAQLLGEEVAIGGQLGCAPSPAWRARPRPPRPGPPGRAPASPPPRRPPWWPPARSAVSPPAADDDLAQRALLGDQALVALEDGLLVVVGDASG